MSDIIQHLLNHAHVAVGLQPGADAFSGTKTTKPVRLGPLYYIAHFLIPMGAGGTGTTLVTMEACDNANGDNPVAIPFEAAKQLTDDTTDAWLGVAGGANAYDSVSAAGFTTVAAAKKTYITQVLRNRLPAGKPWVRLKAVEQVDSPCDGAVLILLTGPGYPTFPPKSVFS